MQLTGNVEIKAPRERVWAFVSDPRQVGWCGPGVQSIEALDATHFTAKANLKLGFFTTGLTVDLEVLDTQPLERVVIRATGHAQGTAVDATTTLNLTGPAAGPTTVAFEADVSISGSFAGVATRFLESGGEEQLGQPLDCIRAKLEV
jgi:carbon monoxide dehydrogenase subunit G